MKKISILILLNLSVVFGFGQNETDLPKIIPPSPNAIAIHTYGNTKVNYYTGSTNITIPIYEIKDGDLTLPIYLKYTAGNGVKVSETASWVGLGWTLNTGGAVSRTIRGIADEKPFKGFWHYNEIPMDVIEIGGFLSNTAFISDIRHGYLDGEPDRFMYNTPSVTGTYYYNFDEEVF